MKFRENKTLAKISVFTVDDWFTLVVSLLSCYCWCSVSPCVGLQCVIVVFPDQTHAIQYVASKARELLAVPKRCLMAV